MLRSIRVITASDLLKLERIKNSAAMFTRNCTIGVVDTHGQDLVVEEAAIKRKMDATDRRPHGGTKGVMANKA